MSRAALVAASLALALLAPASTAAAGRATDQRWRPHVGGWFPTAQLPRAHESRRDGPPQRPSHRPPTHAPVTPPRTTPAGRPPATPPVVAPPAVTLPAVTPPPVVASPKPLGHVQVVAREFSLTLSRTSVAAGPVAIELDNLGQDPHDLRVERLDDPSAGLSFTLARPGTVTTRKLELAPGEWQLYCTLSDHAALGMSARVTVSG